MIRRARRRAKGWSFPLIRDVVLFIAGLAGLAYETVFTKTDRPTLLLLYAAMLGLPAFLQANNDRATDEKEITAALRHRYLENDGEVDAEIERMAAVDADEKRREHLLAELQDVEGRLKDSEPKRYPKGRDRLGGEDGPSISRLPRERHRRDDEDDGNGTHGRGRTRR
jgi:hypothetical protein